MKTILFFLGMVALSSCTKEEVGNTSTFFANTTNHTIKVVPFSGSNIDLGRIKYIPPHSTVEVYTANVRGKTIDPSFGTLLQPYDSVVVYYDDSISIPHIKFNANYAGTHKVLFTDSRSISNQNNYVKVITKETKNSLAGNFTYTFTEQDYLNAR